MDGGKWGLMEFRAQVVVDAINTLVAETTGNTLYEIVFGQSARCNLAELEELSKQGLLD